MDALFILDPGVATRGQGSHPTMSRTEDKRGTHAWARRCNLSSTSSSSNSRLVFPLRPSGCRDGKYVQLWGDWCFVLITCRLNRRYHSCCGCSCLRFPAVAVLPRLAAPAVVASSSRDVQGTFGYDTAQERQPLCQRD